MEGTFLEVRAWESIYGLAKWNILVTCMTSYSVSRSHDCDKNRWGPAVKEVWWQSVGKLVAPRTQ